MWSLIKDGNTYNVPVQTYVCDAAEDIDTLTTECPFGSKAFVIESGATYVLNSEKEWIEWTGDSEYLG